MSPDDGQNTRSIRTRESPLLAHLCMSPSKPHLDIFLRLRVIKVYGHLKNMSRIK